MGDSTRARETFLRGDWYDHPSWYDILHAPGTAEEADGLERIAMRFVRTRVDHRRPMRLFEPACGTGRYLRVLAGRGYDVVGFDAKKGMIAYARATFENRGLHGALFVGEMTSFRIAPKADMAFCTFSTLRHLRRDRDVLAHLQCMAGVLRSGGIYVVGLDIARPGTDRPSHDVWTGARGRCRVTQVVHYGPPTGRSRRERVHSRMHVRTPARDMHLDTTYDLRSYTQSQWGRLIDRSAFRIEGECDPWGDEPARDRTGQVRGGYRVFVLRPRA